MKSIATLILVAFFLFSLSSVSAQNRVVVIPLIDDGITCSGTLVGTRWCDNGDQTVTDMTTGLVWLKHADWGGTMPWRSNTPGDFNDAHSRAGVLRSGDVVRTYNSIFFFLNDGSSQRDWRLPTFNELVNLRLGTNPVSNSNQYAFRGVQSDGYWSSTTQRDNPAVAEGVNFFGPGTGAFASTKSNNNWVWPVRDGNQ